MAENRVSDDRKFVEFLLENIKLRTNSINK